MIEVEVEVVGVRVDVVVTTVLATALVPQAESNRARPPKRILVSDDFRNSCPPTHDGPERSKITILEKVALSRCFRCLLIASVLRVFVW